MTGQVQLVKLVGRIQLAGGFKMVVRLGHAMQGQRQLGGNHLKLRRAGGRIGQVIQHLGRQRIGRSLIPQTGGGQPQLVIHGGRQFRHAPPPVQRGGGMGAVIQPRHEPAGGEIVGIEHQRQPRAKHRLAQIAARKGRLRLGQIALLLEMPICRQPPISRRRQQHAGRENESHNLGNAFSFGVHPSSIAKFRRLLKAEKKSGRVLT